MLETIDPDKKVEKEAYREWFPRLKADLRELQQKVREARVPVIVVFEGWNFSGKADTIRHITEALDPRGFQVHSVESPTSDEREHHWLQRFWVRFPARGRFAVFERSWYGRVLEQRVRGQLTPEDINHAFLEIARTEQMLIDDGAVLIKFWLHISKKEHKKRLKEAETDPFRELDHAQYDRHTYKRYREYCGALEEVLERTNNHKSPWIIVEAGDPRYRRMKVLQTLCEGIANGLNRDHRRRLMQDAPVPQDNGAVSVPVLVEMPTVLDNVDMGKSLSQSAYDKAKDDLQLRLRQMQFAMVKKGVPLVIVYEGWDAAGKGGSIRRLTATLDARFYEVIPISAPTQEEKDHHYLWRFWKYIPRQGHMTIFDRSWYGRVLVERIEKLCSEVAWRRAYQEINDFELMLFQSGTPIIKLWIEITPEEQLARFQARENNPHKRYKMTDEDWRNREKWPQYRDAVDEMIKRTSTTYAPWTIVEGNCKRYARVRVMETVLEVMDKALKAHP